MARLAGSKNKNSSALPMYVTLSTEERIMVIANLVVDRIQTDQSNGKTLLKKILGESHVRTNAH